MPEHHHCVGNLFSFKCNFGKNDYSKQRKDKILLSDILGRVRKLL